MDLTIVLETVIFVILLLVLTVYDLKHRIIPNTAIILIAVNTLVFRMIGIIFSESKAEEARTLAFSFVFSVLVFFILVIFISLADRLAGYETMGGGDIKLLSAIVLFFGMPKGIIAIFLSCIAGIIIYAIGRILNHISKRPESDSSGDSNKTESKNFPFAPAILSACLITVFLGDVMASWYMSLFI